MEPQIGEICNLSDIALQENSNNDSEQNGNAKAPRKPKRILHFSDGVLEEYSSEDDEPAAVTVTNQMSNVDPKTLNWMPWAWYQTTWISSKMLDGCDYMGEWLANFFGITTPKYQFEINEYYRLKALENEMTKQQDLEMGGWNNRCKNNLIQNQGVSQTNT